MDLRLATLKVVSFYFLHNVSTLNQCRKFSCVTVVCKQSASYQDYPNYKWDFSLVPKFAGSNPASPAGTPPIALQPASQTEEEE
jgi:hypothetical protein